MADFPFNGGTTIGFIGLGAMGGAMARNLMRAGGSVVGFDIAADAMERCRHDRFSPASSPADVVDRSDIVCTSLVSPVYVSIAETILLPRARAGQYFVDFSTVPAPQTRDIARQFADRGAIAIDAPVSGWWTGARDATLSIFIGGDPQSVDRLMPLFRALGKPDRICYGGPAGMGQVQKVVQQLKNRLIDAARLEVMSFGVNAGLSIEQVLKVLDVDPAASDGYARLVRAIHEGNTADLACLNSEWAYYLAEADARGFAMPILQSLQAFLTDAPRPTRDEQGRPTANLWQALTRAR